MKNPTSINSIFKAFRLIELYQEPNAEFTLTELTKKVNLSIGAAQRITNSLIILGYLAKDKKTKKYRLTPKWLPIGFNVLASLEIRKLALPHLKQLYKQTGATVSLAVRHGDDVIYLERLITQDLIGFNIRAGLKRPMYPNSMGKAILAFMAEEERDEIIGRSVFKNKEAMDSGEKDGIIKELDQIKEQGYAVNKVQYSGGALAISVPILNHKGVPIAGINIGTPADHPPDKKKFNEYVQLLIRTGRAISSEIGYMDYMGV